MRLLSRGIFISNLLVVLFVVIAVQTNTAMGDSLVISSSNIYDSSWASNVPNNNEGGYEYIRCGWTPNEHNGNMDADWGAADGCVIDSIQVTLVVGAKTGSSGILRILPHVVPWGEGTGAGTAASTGDVTYASSRHSQAAWASSGAHTHVTDFHAGPYDAIDMTSWTAGNTYTFTIIIGAQNVVDGYGFIMRPDSSWGATGANIMQFQSCESSGTKPSITVYYHLPELGLVNVKEVDGSPSDIVNTLIFPNGSVTISDDSAKIVFPAAGIQQGDSLTVKETDGSPSGKVTILQVNNGSLSIAGNTATLNMGFEDLSGTATDGQIPNDITIDKADSARVAGMAKVDTSTVSAIDSLTYIKNGKVKNAGQLKKLLRK